jgi:hypothetical protein
MFRFTRKPSSGSHRQYLAKGMHMVQCGYIEVVQTSVLWLCICSHSAQHTCLTGHTMQP